MSNSVLKPGWGWVKFGDVVKLSGERRANPASEGLERYVGLEHLEPGDLRIRRWGDVGDGTTFTNYFKPGQVLFGKRRAYQRKVAVADFEGVCSGDIYVFEPKDKQLLPDLLPFICQTEAFFDYAIGTSAGSLSPRTNWKSLAQYEFALPTLEGQIELVALFQATSEIADSYSELARIAEAQYLGLLVHIFQVSTHQGRAKWDNDTVANRFSIQLGKMSSAASREADNQKRYIKNSNVYWGHFDLTELSQMSFNPAEQEKFSLKRGDLLVCEGGEIGRAAIWDEEQKEIFYQKALHRLRPRDGENFTEFFMHYLRYCALRGILNGISTGTTILHLPAQNLAALKLPFPPREEQEQILKVLKASWVSIAKAAMHVQKAQNLHKKLMASSAEARETVLAHV